MKFVGFLSGLTAASIWGGMYVVSDVVLKTILNPGEEVINCVPTFGIFRFSTLLCGGKIIEVPRDNDFAVSAAAIKAVITKKTKVIFLVSPNNPTGTQIPKAEILQILETGLPVVIDEAYIEFSGMPGHAGWVLEHGNLIVLRTFSKRGGLAGLRVGYGIFPSALMPHLWKIKQPYNVSVAASAAAIASLADSEHMAEVVKRLVAERNRMAEALSELSFIKVYPSNSNFVLCRVIGRDAKELKLKLEERGILVRYFNKPGLTDCIRISAGKPEHTDELTSVLRNMLRDQNSPRRRKER